jgi:outer membrane protein OmpA-like peptidoglycan-associated protein
MEFIRVPAGSFNMGSPTTEVGRDQDLRLHEVRLSQDFHLQRTEITQGQWRAVMGDNPAFFLNCGDECPVEQVSWEDVQLFLSRLNQLDRNYNYRLPSEAEWEYAARAGSPGALPSGDLQGAEGEALFHDPNLDPIGWYVGNSDQGTHPVGQKQANAWGFYDMHGNVQEWVADWHNTYPFNAVIDPAGPEQGRTKIRRGGSWNLYARLCRSAGRAWASPSLFDPFTGLRLVAFAAPSEPAAAVERELPLPSATSATSWEIFFALDSAELSPAMSALLADIVRDLAATDDQLLLAGHTCDLAPDTYNQKLSEQRVSRVKDYFLRHGIAQHRISTQALGEQQPAYPNDSEDGRKLNRRVVIHLK